MTDELSAEAMENDLIEVWALRLCYHPAIVDQWLSVTSESQREAMRAYARVVIDISVSLDDASAPKPDASDLEHAKDALRSYCATFGYDADGESYEDIIPHFAAALAEARAAERERCAKIAVSWQREDAIKLAAGEMTAQELRTAKAVAGGIERAILAPNPTSMTASLSSSA